MEKSATVVTFAPDAIGFTRPVASELRMAAASLGGAMLIGGIAPIFAYRPTLAAFPDSLLWFLAGLALMAGSSLMALAGHGAERSLSFRARTATVVEEFRAFGHPLVRRILGWETCSGLGALRDDGEPTAPRWRLFLVDAADGAPIEIAEFDRETELHRAAEAIAAIRPDLSLG